MAINFPANPTPNQTIVIGNRAWAWNNDIGVWEAVLATPALLARNLLFNNLNTDLIAENVQDAIEEILETAGGASVVISTTEPLNANEGDLWWDNSEGILYIYYNQNNTLIWVEVTFGEEQLNETDVLTRTNTEAYTPTDDFNPATKKYVDDTTGSKADSDNVLALDNTSLFEPTNNFNPATKKYVDDSVDTLVAGPEVAITDNIPVFDGTTGKVIKDGFGVQDTLSSSATALVRADAIVTALLNKTDKLAQVVTTASGFTVDIDDADTVFVLTNTSAITVSLPDDTGAVQETSTFVFQNPGFFYEIDGTTGQNPTITLVRGQTYTFNFEAVTSSHPIALRLAADNTSVVPGTTGNDPVNGVSGSGAIVTYVVPNNAPNSIVYQCVIHGSMLGTINIVDAVVGTAIPIGTQVAFIRNGIGTVTFAGSGTILSDSGKKDIKSQYSSAAVIKIAADTWQLVGNLIASN